MSEKRFDASGGLGHICTSIVVVVLKKQGSSATPNEIEMKYSLQLS